MSSSDVEVGGLEGVALDVLAPGFDASAHQNGEDLVGSDLVLEVDAVEATTETVLGRYKAPQQLTYADFLRGCPIGCLTVAFDQTMLGKKFMPDVRRGQDWGFWLELTRDGAVAQRYPGCHAYYHRAGESLSSAKFVKAMDIYRIYREQERIGPVRTLYYLFFHVIGALTKRPVRYND